MPHPVEDWKIGDTLRKNTQNSSHVLCREIGQTLFYGLGKT